MSTTAEKVKKIVVEQLGVAEDQVTEDAKFIDDLGADSLDILQLLMTIEETYGIRIPDVSLAGFKTVGDIVGYLKKIKG